MSTKRGTKRKADSSAPAEEASKKTFTEEMLCDALRKQKKKLLSSWLMNEEVLTPKAQLVEAVDNVKVVWKRFQEARRKYYSDHENEHTELGVLMENFFWTKIDDFFSSMVGGEELKNIVFKNLAIICKE